jgi:hypothetical protein
MVERRNRQVRNFEISHAMQNKREGGPHKRYVRTIDTRERNNLTESAAMTMINPDCKDKLRRLGKTAA